MEQHDFGSLTIEPVKESIKTEPIATLLTKEEATKVSEKTAHRITLLEKVTAAMPEATEKPETLDEFKKEFEDLFPGHDIQESNDLLYTLKHQRYQYDTAAENGEKYIEIQYPTGVYYQESDFVKDLKEKEDLIKGLYAYGGRTIDTATERIIDEYNRTNPDGRYSFANGDMLFDTEKRPAHALLWYSVEVIDTKDQKGLKMVYGAVEYTLARLESGAWSVRMEDGLISTDPYDAEKKKLYAEVKTWLQDRANEILK